MKNRHDNACHQVYESGACHCVHRHGVALSSDYQVQELPHTVVIDRDGTVRAVFKSLGLEALDKTVEQSMAAR